MNYDCDPVGRKVLAARLRRFTTAAMAPGSQPVRQRAADSAGDVADRVVALLIRDRWPDDELAAALAEYLEARADGFGGWQA